MEAETCRSSRLRGRDWLGLHRGGTGIAAARRQVVENRARLVVSFGSSWAAAIHLFSFEVLTPFVRGVQPVLLASAFPVNHP